MCKIKLNNMSSYPLLLKYNFFLYCAFNIEIYYIIFYQYKFHIFYLVCELESSCGNSITNICSENVDKTVVPFGQYTDQLDSGNTHYSYTCKLINLFI